MTIVSSLFIRHITGPLPVYDIEYIWIVCLASVAFICAFAINLLYWCHLSLYILLLHTQPHRSIHHSSKSAILNSPLYHGELIWLGARFLLKSRCTIAQWIIYSIPLRYAHGAQCLFCCWYIKTHWGPDTIVAILLTFSNAFSGIKMFESRLKFHKSLFLEV